MLTKLTIRNFKRFEEVEIELGNPVVFIGPNNSGKTSAMQALALWDIGLRRWREKHAGRSTPEKRPGAAVNRRDLYSIPHPTANHLWRDLRVRNVERKGGRNSTSNVRIDLIVEGVSEDKVWRCGLEFDFANPESFYCRPLRTDGSEPAERMPVPEHLDDLRIAFLPPMSGLTANETRLDIGALNVRVGEGRTAEVLRNLCYRVKKESSGKWASIANQIEALFGAKLAEPRYVEQRGEIAMSYHENGVELDISASGRGLQQTLLILAYMHANPGAVILLDEPDAHLEILRQRQTYHLINESARESGSQIIAASHSEVLLNEAAEKDLVIAFLGKPHSLGGGRSQVRKALAEIGFDQYYQAEQLGWVLYLEGATDLEILRAFARRLRHQEAIRALERPFVHYVRNQPSNAENHFFGIREALPALRGVALYDRLEAAPQSNPFLSHLMWQRREIENYFCTQRTLQAYARGFLGEFEDMPLFLSAEQERRAAIMDESIAELVGALETLGKGTPWSKDLKVSDEFLTPLFKAYFQRLELPNFMYKKDFYELANCLPDDEIDPEIAEKLDKIAEVARSG